ncbi:sulfotransferase family 2 domain-containing protein [Mesorhizobium sp. ANAO-SY3R2]|uniref:sulfotransferase family 2 domain-containing protein n=1 Tax=Mesorhizobium sp. ANAO-SY3R2 TaxID=3166644 RepID=UPI00366F97BA
MIVSHQHKFIFLKTRKTAGTSLEIGLSEFCGPEDIITAISRPDQETRSRLGFRGPQNHMSPKRFWKKSRPLFRNHNTAAQVKAALSDDIWRDYFKFTLERNPFDKAISLYWWSTRSAAVRPDLTSFLHTVPTYKLSNWGVYAIEDCLAVDFVVRFETMSQDLLTLEQKLGIGPIQLVRAKSSHRVDRRPYREVLSPSDRSLIERVCAREMKEFSYDW